MKISQKFLGISGSVPAENNTAMGQFYRIMEQLQIFFSKKIAKKRKKDEKMKNFKKNFKKSCKNQKQRYINRTCMLDP